MAKKDKKNLKENVSADIIYQEMFEEMRRFRDYELNSSSWYTTILLALLGFVVTVKYGNGDFDKLTGYLDANIAVQALFSFVITLLGWSSVCSVRYASMRYHEIKDHLFNKKNKKRLSALGWSKFDPARRVIYPVRLIYIIHYTILVISNSVIFLPNGWCVVLFINFVVTIAFALIFIWFFPKKTL